MRTMKNKIYRGLGGTGGSAGGKGGGLVKKWMIALQLTR